jgi:hypothetical protein
MELWQLDIVGGVKLASGGEAKVVTGVDDHSGSVPSPPLSVGHRPGRVSGVR